MINITDLFIIKNMAEVCYAQKILVVLMAMLMGITMLTGCAGNNKADVKKIRLPQRFYGSDDRHNIRWCV